jgi:hypothetical protein
MVLRQFIDFPIVQWCEHTPDSQYHGLTAAYDLDKYIYWLRGYNSNAFRRYSIFGDVHQYLASAPWNAQQGAMLVYDPSRSRFWAIQGNGGTGFAYYTPSTNAWTSVASLPAASNYGSGLFTRAQLLNREQTMTTFTMLRHTVQVLSTDTASAEIRSRHWHRHRPLWAMVVLESGYTTTIQTRF